MPSALTLALTDAERRTLCDARKRHDKPYVRERAAALLKIDDGWSGRKVAREGLLQSRTPDTVYTSYHDWQDHGIAALHIEEGRGLWARFSPEHSLEEEAREAALRLVRRTPRSMGLDRTRWTLGLLARKMEAVGDIPDSTRLRRILESARPIGHLLQAGALGECEVQIQTTKRSASTPPSGFRRPAPTQT